MLNLISNSECVKILRKSLKTDSLDYSDISSFAVERTSGDLVGFMGEYYKLIVNLKDKRRLSYFIKSVPITNEIHRKECLDKKFFDKETRIYTDILVGIQKYVPIKMYPECYFTRPDVLVLEDLSMQPLRHITDRKDITFDYCKVVLTLLANLHAGSIALEYETGINIGQQFKDILFDLQLTLNNTWYITAIKGIVFLAKQIPKYKGTAMESFIAEDLYDALCLAAKLSEQSSRYRNVLCHRDAWSRNIFFKCDAKDTPVGCLIVDFQLAMYNPQAIDILNFLFMAMRRKQREAIYDKCLQFYYNTFVGLLHNMGFQKEVISRSEFFESCDELLLVALTWKAASAPLIEMPDGLANKMRAEEKIRFDYYMNTNREEMFSRIMDIDPSYKEAIFEPVEELLEYIQRKMKIV